MMSSGNGKAGGGGGAGSDYQHDVFLSYSYKPDVRDWVTKKFLPNFLDPLYSALVNLSNAEYPPPPVEVARVYNAREKISPGDVWPDELRYALQRSRVLVAICSPPYFVSGWCMSEWQAFQQRGQRLIIPVLYDGTNNYLLAPDRIGNIHFDDFRSFMYVSGGAMPGFRARVKALANAVAAKVLAAPPYTPPGPPPAGFANTTPNVPLLTL